MAIQQMTSALKANIEKLPDNLKEKVINWLEWDMNVQTWNEIAQLVDFKNIKRLSEMLLNRQCFGTAGIRGIMEAGFNGLNDLVIIQTSQGLATYLKASSSNSQDICVVVGFDGRYHSHKFARLASKVFLEAGFKVGLFSKVVPTPFVAFATKIFAASAGIMITASHNPKQYNGYKVFGSNGAQILSPHDKNIQDCILEHLKPWNDRIWDVESLSYISDSQIFDPLFQVSNQYYNELLKSATQLELVNKSDLKITYTALHGVGHEALTRVFQEFGLVNHFPVLSQKDPDPEFPTVCFPNPEEGQGVFNESIKTASQNGSPLIFANDPDSDRFCMGEKCENEWRIFNGNEIGAMLGWWQWNQFQILAHTKNVNKSDCYMISSAVSSKILETYARKEGFNFIETLTGFKWMANYAYDLERQGKQVLFCFEEAIGFMTGTIVYDKDGISTTASILQLAAFLYSKGQTFTELLNEIYKTYGFHYSLNSYYLCYDSEKVKKIIDRIANIDGPNLYVKSINGIKVTRIRDLIRNYDSSTKDRKATLPSSCMLTFYFENGSVITFRTSGTEPKIKYYSEIVTNPSDIDWDKIKNAHQELIKSTLQVILQPDENGLIAKKE